MPVSPASSSTASCPAIPACRPSSSITGPASGASGAGSRKTSLITIATCPACSPPDGLISSAVAQTAASAARRSARSCSLPSISSVSFLRPASASCSTSHLPRASATNTTPAVCQPPCSFPEFPPAPSLPEPQAQQRHAAFTWTTATSTAGMTRTPQSSPEQDSSRQTEAPWVTIQRRGQQEPHSCIMKMIMAASAARRGDNPHACGSRERRERPC